MTKGSLNIFISQSIILSLRRNSCILPIHPSKSHSFEFFGKKSLPLFTRFFITSSPDDLDGLINPDLNLPDNVSALQDSYLMEAVATEDFGFLKDSLMKSGTVCGHQLDKIDSRECSSEAILVCNMMRDNNDGFGDKILKYLRQFRGKLSESLVVDVLKNIQSAELGVKFFIWAGQQIGYRHTFPVYDALLDLLGCGENFRVSEHFLREIKDDDEQVLRKLINVLIRKCCRSGMWNVALEELGRLKDYGFKPSIVTYNALIRVFLEADRLDTAYLVKGEMSDLNFKMDAHTLGLFSNSLCKRGQWREALDLIEEEEFMPDTVMYTKMISGLCEASLFEEAMDFLDKMRSSSCIPNVVTYRILLCGCLNKNELGRCKRILSIMITEGCYPSPKIFSSLVHAYCRSGDYAYAYKLLRKMVSCGCRPGYVVYNIFIGGICGNEELPTPDVLELAEKAYTEMLDAGIVLNKVNVSNFAWCLCGAGKFEKAYNVISEMMSKGFIPDISTYSKVISFLCNASKVDKAFLLFQELKRNRVVPDVHTYSILIDTFCKAGLIPQARSWFDEMIRDGCTPNVVTYTALIHAYLKSKKVSDANKLFELMLLEGCMPNVVTFTALIDGHCKAGDIDKACRIYAKMRGSDDIPDVDMYFKVDGSFGKEPNVVTYGALIDGLCKAHRTEEARNLLDVMSIDGCEPNHIVYDALIDGFCKVGKLDEAQGVFAKMSERGYSPNVYTYGSLIDSLFKNRRLDLALKVLSKMLENSCPPNVIIYTEMIDGLCKIGKIDEAYKLLSMMEEKGCHPNVVTYTAMMDGFGKVGKVDKCLELLKRMGSNGCAPNYVTYRVLINHCCAAGLLDEAHQLLDEMKQTYWPKQMASYRKVIEGFNRDFIARLGILDEIDVNDGIPIVPLYELLSNSFCKAGRVDAALELHKEISSSSTFSSVDRNIYASLIESLCLSCRVDNAFELYVDMLRRGGVPELSMFFNLIKGLFKVSRWEEALQLACGLCYSDIRWLPDKFGGK